MTESNDCTPLTRRSFIGAAGAVGVAVSAGPLAGQAAGKRALGARGRSVDVVVVGAGILLAFSLAALGALHARLGSIGGLCWRPPTTASVGGPLNAKLPHGQRQVVEAGGQWAGPAQTEVLALAKALGVKTFQRRLLEQTEFLDVATAHRVLSVRARRLDAQRRLARAALALADDLTGPQ